MLTKLICPDCGDDVAMQYEMDWIDLAICMTCGASVENPLGPDGQPRPIRRDAGPEAEQRVAVLEQQIDAFPGEGSVTEP